MDCAQIAAKAFVWGSVLSQFTGLHPGAVLYGSLLGVFNSTPRLVHPCCGKLLPLLSRTSPANALAENPWLKHPTQLQDHSHLLSRQPACQAA